MFKELLGQVAQVYRRSIEIYTAYVEWELGQTFDQHWASIYLV